LIRSNSFTSQIAAKLNISNATIFGANNIYIYFLKINAFRLAIQLQQHAILDETSHGVYARASNDLPEHGSFDLRDKTWFT
jgi:hypothetical protein